MTDRSIAWFGGGDRPVNGSGNTTFVRPDDDDVEEATVEDLRIGVRRALDHCGLTWPELETQGRTGDFTSVRARMAWVAIGDLGHLAPEDPS